jgi:hypothetical protein
MNRSAIGILAHPEATRAFKVTEQRGDNGCVIVWARHYLEAKREGASGLDLTYEDVDCEREPALDNYSGGDLMGDLIEMGWWFNCSHCDRACYDEKRFRVGDDIFCNAECHQKHEAYWQPKRALEAAFRKFTEVKFFGKPFVRFAYVNVREEALLYDHDPSGRMSELLTISRTELGL